MSRTVPFPLFLYAVSIFRNMLQVVSVIKFRFASPSTRSEKIFHVSINPAHISSRFVPVGLKSKAGCWYRDLVGSRQCQSPSTPAVYANRWIAAERGEGEHSGHTYLKGTGDCCPSFILAQFYSAPDGLLLFYGIGLGYTLKLLWKWRSQTARKYFLKTCREQGKLSQSWRVEEMLKVIWRVSQIFINASIWTDP